MQITTREKTKRRSLAWIGVCCISLSVFSFLLSFGMPGVGWSSAILAMISSAVLTPWAGKRYVTITLLVSILHLFVLGPLSAGNKSMAIQLWPPSLGTMFFVFLPILVALIAVLLPKRFLRKN